MGDDMTRDRVGFTSAVSSTLYPGRFVISDLYYGHKKAYISSFNDAVFGFEFLSKFGCDILATVCTVCIILQDVARICRQVAQ